MTHTPGPWKYAKNVTRPGYYVTKVGSGTYPDLAAVHWQKPYTGKKEAEDNARLLAAAPELLEACEQMVKAFRKSSAVPTSLNAAYYLIRAAIAKATVQQ